MSFQSILGLGPDTSFQVSSSRLPVKSAYLTWGDPINDPPAALGTMTFDAVLSEEHDRSAVVTDHPVEQGTNIVDNVRPLPDELTLEVFISNSPIASPDAPLSPVTLDLPMPGQGSFLAGGTGAIVSSLIYPSIPGPTIGASVQAFAGETDYVRQAYETLTTLQSTATLLSVITPRAQYTNMILRSVRMHRDAGTGTSANFTLDLREVVIVYSGIVAAPLPSIPRAAPPAAAGKQASSPADGPKASLAKTAANKSGLAIAGSGL